MDVASITDARGEQKEELCQTTIRDEISQQVMILVLSLQMQRSFTVPHVEEAVIIPNALA